MHFLQNLSRLIAVASTVDSDGDGDGRWINYGVASAIELIPEAKRLHTVFSLAVCLTSNEPIESGLARILGRLGATWRRDPWSAQWIPIHRGVVLYVKFSTDFDLRNAPKRIGPQLSTQPTANIDFLLRTFPCSCLSGDGRTNSTVFLFLWKKA